MSDLSGGEGVAKNPKIFYQRLQTKSSYCLWNSYGAKGEDKLKMVRPFRASLPQPPVVPAGVGKRERIPLEMTKNG